MMKEKLLLRSGEINFNGNPSGKQNTECFKINAADEDHDLRHNAN